MDKNSLAHTKWECKYHIVFAPKYRRMVIYKDIKADVGQILGALCRRKGIEIIEAECCPDHIHMLVRIPPKYSVLEKVVIRITKQLKQPEKKKAVVEEIKKEVKPSIRERLVQNVAKIQREETERKQLNKGKSCSSDLEL